MKRYREEFPQVTSQEAFDSLVSLLEGSNSLTRAQMIMNIFERSVTNADVANYSQIEAAWLEQLSQSA